MNKDPFYLFLQALPYIIYIRKEKAEDGTVQNLKRQILLLEWFILPAGSHETGNR